MKTLFIESNNGISGDMTLGALVDLGVDVADIKRGLDKIGISDYDIVANNGEKNGVTGINLDVIVPEIDDHDHTSYQSIKKMIEDSTLNENVKKLSINIFEKIAVAEGAVHGMPMDKVMFHEVGAMDSIIDIVGTAIAVDIINPDRILTTSVHDGSGTIKCRHGIIPVPVPAVMEMLKRSEIPITIEDDVTTEMVTPTGFGILEGLQAKYTKNPELKVNKVGYGFGKRDTGRFNAVRMVIGDMI